ncbi:phosphotransferase family protein [Nocardia miyunensis]|uniref:phosphotransferase family protein n=1 Tax=Nocardia miyunensis TaxID=282684 RepID=UPI00082B113F|nr:aminoglycoside phosphotransferase family protein [Nocardia miyunensis]
MTESDDIPTDATELTPERLTASLRDAGQDVVVESVAATPIGSGQMAGSFRLDLAYRGDTELPSRMVAKLATGPKTQREFASGAFRNEVRFYRDLSATVRVPVPRCHASAVSESGSEFLLLLDDLAPAEQGDQIAGCTVTQARAVAVAAAGLHGPRWCDETLLHEPGFALPTDADRALMESVLAPMASAFRDRFADRLTAPESALLDWLEATAGEWLVAPIEHFALLHGDLRVDNVMFGPDDTATVIDWQTITPGQPLRDIAFLLSTSLTTDDRRAAEESLLADYHKALLAYGVTGYSLEQCRRDYAVSLIQAPLIIVFGCGASQPTERGDRMFLTMLARSAAAVHDLVPGALG